MTQLERRESSLRRIKIRAALNARLFGKSRETPDPQGHKKKFLKKKQKTFVPFAESEALPYTPPEQHHHISASRNTSHHVASWLNEQGDDPATRVCTTLFPPDLL
jgi:hypothetical protein